MKTYNALSKSFTDEVKIKMIEGSTIDDAFEDVKTAIIDYNFGEPTPTPKPIDVNELTQGDGQQDGYYYVDLGLSVKWATCNVGSVLASDEGKLFQFGRVDGYIYGDKNNQFKTHSQNKQDTGNEFIPKTTSGKVYKAGDILELEDDAAHANMGGAWRMPTKDQLEELYGNTTYDVVTVNGVQGMLFTSTKPGYEGKHIFIPFMQGYWYNGSFTSAGSYASVWSSQVHPSLVHSVYSLDCNSSGPASIRDYSRSYAFSVRGVFKK